jgi:uncharacterized damage-inducible protein DinB
MSKELKRSVLLPATGLSPGVAYYFSAMEEVRGQVRQAVSRLSNEEISTRALAGAHPIGALLLHIGEAEYWWIQCVVAGRTATDEDKLIAHWDVLDDPDSFASKGYSAEYCLDSIDRIRAMSRDVLSSLDDNALDRLYRYESPKAIREVSLRWVLHHLIDHEAQHKGQILMLKRLLG